ncbi:MAG: hypothetical protein ACLTPN_00870 [Clostridia bacterium]
MKTKFNLTQNRDVLEGNFVLSLYKNPIELYGDFPINAENDLLTSDGRFYYNLGLNMVNKGIKTFDEISLMSFLNDYPELKLEYEDKGGWKPIHDYMEVLDEANVEAYYNDLVKNNLLIRLDEKGFNVKSNMNIFSDLNTADEVIDFLDAQLNGIALNITHDLKLETLQYTEKDIERKQSGEQVGLQFSKACPLLNSFCNGIPRKGLTMLASYTNGGKTSFVFENIVLPLVDQEIKVCVISNEQDSIVFKDLLYLHVLTSDLDYWKINRTKLKDLDFDKEDWEYFNKANEIINDKYKDYIRFQRVYDYSMKNVKRTIKKLGRQGFDLFIYDTFKVDATTEVVWQSFLNDSKELFQIASKEGVAIITPVQIALSTKGRVRYLNEGVLSNSKQISEIYEEIFMFRDIWKDEYSDGDEGKRIVPYFYKKDKDGFTNIREEIPLVEGEGKHYKIFFHSKSRNGEAGRTVAYEFVPNFNKWKEIGLCKVGEENRL